MDQIWHRPNLVGPNMAPTKFGWTKNGSDQIWVWNKYGLDQIWARPNMLDQIWSDQKWPTKSVSTKSGLTPHIIPCIHNSVEMVSYEALSPLLLDSTNPCMVYFMIFLYHLE